MTSHVTNCTIKLSVYRPLNNSHEKIFRLTYHDSVLYETGYNVTKTFKKQSASKLHLVQQYFDAMDYLLVARSLSKTNREEEGRQQKCSKTSHKWNRF